MNLPTKVIALCCMRCGKFSKVLRSLDVDGKSMLLCLKCAPRPPKPKKAAA